MSPLHGVDAHFFFATDRHLCLLKINVMAVGRSASRNVQSFR